MDVPPELIAAVNLAQWPILALPGVVGVGVGMREANGELIDEVAIRVAISDRAQIPDGIPSEVGGVAVCIVEERVNPVADLARYSPLVGGIRIEHPTKGFGTLGAVVQDSATGELLGLSVFHVAGNGADDFPITLWQPQAPNLIAGTPPPATDNIGRVVRFELPQTQPLPLSPVLVGLVEASVFSLIPALNQGRNLSAAIAGENQAVTLVNRITSTAWPIVGQEVRKRGFVTIVTGGVVIAGPMTYQWTAGAPNQFLMEQYVVQANSGPLGLVFCDGGDSGSIILDKNSDVAIGLLWGESNGRARGYFCAIKNVESQLKVNAAWQ